MRLADELGLLADGHLVVAARWVPFEQRSAFLLESDIGVCAYYDSDETRLSFRTRYLDHLWAGLPTLSTDGGSLTEQMVTAGAAATVPAGDAQAWADALVASPPTPLDVRRWRTPRAGWRRTSAGRWPPHPGGAARGLDAVPHGRAPGAITTARYYALAARNRLDAMRSRA